MAIFFDTVGNFQGQIVFLLVCLAVYQAVRKRWVWMLVILGLVALPALNLISFYLPASQPPPGPQKISILSMNLFKNNQSWERVAELIREVDADIVQLIEFTPQCDEAIGAELDRYPYQLGRENYGIVTLGKIPIQRDEFMPHAFDPWVRPGVGTKLNVDGQQVFLLGVHPPSPVTPWRWATRDDRIKDLTEACWFRRKYMHVVVV
ncbi:MAG: hypothetical protein ACR2NP_00580, partial [Pirellulaceae bacterium]